MINNYKLIAKNLNLKEELLLMANMLMLLMVKSLTI